MASYLFHQHVRITHGDEEPIFAHCRVSRHCAFDKEVECSIHMCRVVVLLKNAALGNTSCPRIYRYNWVAELEQATDILPIPMQPLICFSRRRRCKSRGIARALADNLEPPPARASPTFNRWRFAVLEPKLEAAISWAKRRQLVGLVRGVMHGMADLLDSDWLQQADYRGGESKIVRGHDR